VTSCKLVETDRHFEGMRCLKVRGKRHVQRARSSYTASHPVSEHSSHSVSLIKTSQLMLYREIIAVCSQIHAKHINTLCGLDEELLKVKLAVHITTTTTICRHIFQPCTPNYTIWRLPFRYSEQNSACVCRLCQPHNQSRPLDISSSIYRLTDTHYVVCVKHTWYKIRLSTCHTPVLS
jgi:hypothetical protein